MTYTPGPWTEDGRQIWPANGKPEDHILASCYQVPPYDAAANARLIAAAPALVEALEAVMLRWEDYLHMATTMGEKPAYTEQAAEYGKQARAALKLAKGE